LVELIMTLQEQVNSAVNVILNMPRIPKQVRKFGIETDYRISGEDILALTLPEGIELYETNGMKYFETKDKKTWVCYLLIKEDLDLARIGE